MNNNKKWILKGVRLSDGKSHIWVLDKSTNKMVKVDYTDLGMDFFSRQNASQEYYMKPIVKPKPKPKEKSLTEMKINSVLPMMWIR